jgi:hypothetical protein
MLVLINIFQSPANEIYAKFQNNEKDLIAMLSQWLYTLNINFESAKKSEILKKYSHNNLDWLQSAVLNYKRPFNPDALKAIM